MHLLAPPDCLQVRTQRGEDTDQDDWNEMLFDAISHDEGITCRACGDACDTRAIRFQLQTAGRATPRLDPSLCSGCGSCIATCPIQVIQIQEAA